MSNKNLSESEDRFIKYWESKRVRSKWLYSILFSLLYGVILSVLLLYFKDGSLRSISADSVSFLLYAFVFAVLWFVKSMWQWSKMEKRYKVLKEREKQPPG